MPPKKLCEFLYQTILSRRIEHSSSDIKDQICKHFEALDEEVSLLLSLQVDESTDISGKAKLLAFNQFIKDKNVSASRPTYFAKTYDQKRRCFQCGERKHFALQTAVEKRCQCLRR